MTINTDSKRKTAARVLPAAVFVLLAAVCVFAGAGAAATDNETDLGDVYAWKLYGTSADTKFTDLGINLGDNDVWTNGEYTITFVLEPGSNPAAYYFSGRDLVEGTYSRVINDTTTKKYVNYKINVKAAPAAPTGVVYKDGVAVVDLADAVIDTSVDAGFSIVVNTDEGDTIAWTNPDGYLTTIDATQLGFETDLGGKVSGVYDLGTYTVQKIILKGDSNYSALTPCPLLGYPTYFTLYKADGTKSLKALVDEVLQGYLVTVELTAPYSTEGYKIGVYNGTIPAGQAGVNKWTVGSGEPAIPTGLDDKNSASIPVDLSGVKTFVVKSSNKDNIIVNLYKKEGTGENTKWVVDKTITIKVKAGVITADAASASTFIGNEVKLSGTNELGGNLTLFVKGPNFKFAEIKSPALVSITQGKEWDAKINTAELTSNGKKPDAGNYTIYVAKLTEEGKAAIKDITAANLDDEKYCDAYTTVVVALKQPFIHITEAPTYVVKGDKLVINGTAEGRPENVMWYIFGNNFFDTGFTAVNEKGRFKITYAVPKSDDMMPAGQYYTVIQHSMYDRVFNVGPVASPSGGYDIKKNERGSYDDAQMAYVLFNTKERQGANAAQALCDALDDQNIDDMYAKVSFSVGAPTSIINPLPEQIVKGEILTVSGAAPVYKGEVVSVELLSTAFPAIPKELVPPSSFISVTTRVGDNGLWSVTIDTSGLNADDYTISVAVEQLAPVTKKIKIVDGTIPKTTYTLTDPEAVSGGPLQIVGKEIVVHNLPRPEPTIAPTPAPTQEPGQKSSGSSIWLPPLSDSEFETGDSVKATLQVLVPKDTVRDADKISFDSGLTGASWTVSIISSGGVPLSIMTLFYPNNYLSGFDVHYPYDILLDITLTGYVPAGDLSEISVMKVSTTSNRGSGLKSYNVLMNSSTPDTDLTLQQGWNFISVPKKLAAENDTAGELFAGVNTGGKAPLSYNAQTKQWEQVTDSTVISPLNAYWIYSTEKHALNPAFDTTPSVPSVKNVYTGWNAVGASAEEPIAAKVAFTGVNWRSYTLWNADSQKYGTIYVKGGTGKYSDEQTILLYKGGWLYMDGDGTINGYA